MDDETLMRNGGPELTGLTTQPEGDTVNGHTVRGEESPVTLANSSGSPDATTMGSGPPPRIKVVRSSTRFLIETAGKQKPKDGEKWPVDKDLVTMLRNCQRLYIMTANLMMRELVRQDTTRLDAFIIGNARKPKTAREWPQVKVKANAEIGELDLYRMGRLAAPELGTGIVSLLARAVAKKWSSERWEAMIKETRSPPHYRAGQSWQVRASEVGVEKDAFDVTVYSKSNGKTSFKLPISARDMHQRKLLQGLLNGTFKHGNLTIEQDRLRPWKWYARIAYTRLVDKARPGPQAAINRGIKNMVTVAVTTGERWSVEGTDVTEYLRRIQARRRQLQRQVKWSNRVGHGLSRTLHPIKILEDKAHRWRRTWNQTVARRTAQRMASLGVEHVFIEDLTGVRDGEPERLAGGERIWKRVQEWPFFDFGSRLTACLEEVGIGVTAVPAEYISQKCPQCGHIAAENRNLGKWRLNCVSCEASFDLDVAAAFNVLLRGLGRDILK